MIHSSCAPVGFERRAEVRHGQVEDGEVHHRDHARQGEDGKADPGAARCLLVAHTLTSNGAATESTSSGVRLSVYAVRMAVIMIMVVVVRVRVRVVLALGLVRVADAAHGPRGDGRGTLAHTPRLVARWLQHFHPATLTDFKDGRRRRQRPRATHPGRRRRYRPRGPDRPDRPDTERARHPPLLSAPSVGCWLPGWAPLPGGPPAQQVEPGEARPQIGDVQDGDQVLACIAISA